MTKDDNYNWLVVIIFNCNGTNNQIDTRTLQLVDYISLGAYSVKGI